MKQYIPILKHLLTGCMIAVLCAGCYNYWQTVTVNPRFQNKAMRTMDSLKLQNRLFVLRNGDDNYYMRNLQISSDNTAMTFTADSLPNWHHMRVPNKYILKKRYSKTDPFSLNILNEVHLYIPHDSNIVVQGKYSLALNQVQKIEVIQKDQKRTTNSYVLGALGYSIGAAVLVTAIVLATKSSCPFVSAWDGKQFRLQGEIYGGAIYPQLARHDYLPLQMAPNANGQLQVKISNELQERQYTDLASLLVITHKNKTGILADETGHLYSAGIPIEPHTAWLNNKQTDLLPILRYNDQVVLFMDDTTHRNGQNELQLQFHKPAGASNAKLVLAVKNSYWLDYLYGELAKGFGRFYPMYIKKQNNKTPEELLRWVKEQQIPLTVSVKTNDGWKEITSLTTIGPVAARKLVVPLHDLPPAEELQVKLSGGFMFWEIDHAAIDYSAEEAFTVKEYAPVNALDELNKNVLPQLQKEDGIYCAQPVPGNIATLTYDYDRVTDTAFTQTFILHTRGYYTHVRHFKGGINKTFLKQFKQRDAFTTFSRQRYRQINQSQQTALSQQ